MTKSIKNEFIYILPTHVPDARNSFSLFSEQRVKFDIQILRLIRFQFESHNAARIWSFHVVVSGCAIYATSALQ